MEDFQKQLTNDICGLLSLNSISFLKIIPYMILLLPIDLQMYFAQRHTYDHHIADMAPIYVYPDGTLKYPISTFPAPPAGKFILAVKY